MLMFTTSLTNTDELRLMTSHGEREVSSLATRSFLEVLPMLLSIIFNGLACKAAPHLRKESLAWLAPTLTEVTTVLCTKDILKVCPPYQ